MGKDDWHIARSRTGSSVIGAVENKCMGLIVRFDLGGNKVVQKVTIENRRPFQGWLLQ